MLLLLAAVGVFFLLPRAIERKQSSAPHGELPATPAIEATDVEPEAPPDPGESARRADTEAAERALGELIGRRGQLEALRAPQWAEKEWSIVLQHAQRGDQHLQAGESRAATAAYREAIARLDALEQRSTILLEESLGGGEAALERADPEQALERFSLALLIDPENPRATRGLERAAKIEEVFALLRTGQELEQAGELDRAQEAYASAQALDPQLTRPEQAIARVAEKIEAARFEGAMSDAYGAVAGRRYAAAARSFRDALRRRPDSRAARDGLAQAEDGMALQAIARHRNRALELEQQEQWKAALQEHQATLAIDATLAFAQRGAEHSARRSQLSDRLDALRESPERLSTREVRESAVALLRAAVAIPDPGPRLKEQITALAEAIDRANSQVWVVLESDGITDVTLYRVGPLGRFRRHELSVLPGSYTVVGTRDGYRDVRRVFSVRAGERPNAVVVRCEEPL